MAASKADLAGLYPQRKPISSNNNRKALQKPTSAITDKKSDCNEDGVANEFHSAQPQSAISLQCAYGQEDLDDVEEILRQFDLNLSYGPCLGVSRLERWERASRFGLNPSRQIKDILERAGGAPNCLWEGHV